jgi:hypothetical protein
MHIYDFNRETDIAKFEREMAAWSDATDAAN